MTDVFVYINYQNNLPLLLTSSVPTSCPSPCTTFSTPDGSPARTAASARSEAVEGVNSEGLATTVQPAARAGAIWNNQQLGNMQIRRINIITWLTNLDAHLPSKREGTGADSRD